MPRAIRLFPRPALFLCLPLWTLLTACGPTPPSGDAASSAALARLEERFTPGLHTLMVTIQHRHASLWFAGDAGNWPLADYHLHELEEVLAEAAELHPEYDGVQVAALLETMTAPVLEEVEAAVRGEDREAFTIQYDRLTGQCNACHIAADRAVLVIQRPTALPLGNLRFDP